MRAIPIWKLSLREALRENVEATMKRRRLLYGCFLMAALLCSFTAARAQDVVALSQVYTSTALSSLSMPGESNSVDLHP